jgi:hypothetical protein
MTETALPVEPFRLRGCALVVQSAGHRAQNLKELRDGLTRVPSASLHYHFWGRLLRPRPTPDRYNDFAAWVAQDVGDLETAERLDALNPSLFPDLEALREAVLSVLDERVTRGDFLSWARSRSDFFFVKAQMLVFDTGSEARSPRELGEQIARSHGGSVFYHFVDARRRTPDRRDDYSTWLASRGVPEEALRPLARLDPYLFTLRELRDRLAELIGDPGRDLP